MIEVYHNGVLKYTLQEVGTPSDFIVIPVEISKSCTMSADGFKEVFYHYLKDSKTHLEAYEKTEAYHEQFFTERKYSGYTSFKVAMSKAHNRT
jgi:hypothetical protein